MRFRADLVILVLLLCFGLIMTLAELSEPSLSRSSECRTAVVAREMLAANDFIVPHLNGELRLEKPPLYYWAIIPVAQLLGVIDDFTARLPAYIFTLVLMVLTAAFVMQRSRWQQLDRPAVWLSGLFAMIAILSQSGLWFRTTAAEAESLLGVATGLVIYFLYRDLREPAMRWRLLAYLASGLAFMVKGPVFLLFSWPIYLVLARKRLKSDLKSHGLGLLLCILVALPWYFWVILRLDQGWDVFSREVAMRFKSHAPHTEPFYFYLQMLLEQTGGLLTAVIAGCVLAWRRGREQVAEKYLVLLFGLALVTLSLLQSKQLHYLIPLMPVMGLFASDCLMYPWQLSRRGEQVVSGLQWFLMIIVALGGVAVLMMGSYTRGIGIMFAVALMFWLLRYQGSAFTRIQTLAVSAVITSLVFYVGYWHYANPIRDFKHDYSGFFSGMESTGMMDELVMSYGNPCIVYCSGDKIPNYEIEEFPIDLGDVRKQFPGKRYFLTKAQEVPLDAMPLGTLDRGEYWLLDLQHSVDDFPPTALALSGREVNLKAEPALTKPVIHSFPCGEVRFQEAGGVAMLRIELNAGCTGDAYAQTLHLAQPLFAQYIDRWEIIWLSADSGFSANPVAAKVMAVFTRFFAETVGSYLVIDETGIMDESKPLPNKGHVVTLTPGQAVELKIENAALEITKTGEESTHWQQKIVGEKLILEQQS